MDNPIALQTVSQIESSSIFVGLDNESNKRIRPRFVTAFKASKRKVESS